MLHYFNREKIEHVAKVKNTDLKLNYFHCNRCISKKHQVHFAGNDCYHHTKAHKHTTYNFSLSKNVNMQLSVVFDIRIFGHSSILARIVSVCRSNLMGGVPMEHETIYKTYMPKTCRVFRLGQ